MSTGQDHDAAQCDVCIAYRDHFAESGTAYERKLLAALDARHEPVIVECIEFDEDPDDASMCMCGRPALGHPTPGDACVFSPDSEGCIKHLAPGG